MKFSHEEIKGKLPDYIKEGLLPDEVKAHLKTCSECSEEVSLLRALSESPVPEPGDMFFETLPQRIKASLREKKKNTFFKFAPAFALLALVVVAGYIYYSMRVPQVYEEISFSSPLDPQVYDISELSPDDIPSISETLEGNGTYTIEETSFIREFASLNLDEMEDLYEALKVINGNGGAL